MFNIDEIDYWSVEKYGESTLPTNQGNIAIFSRQILVLEPANIVKLSNLKDLCSIDYLIDIIVSKSDPHRDNRHIS